jgi:type I restriction enzyme M protein
MIDSVQIKSTIKIIISLLRKDNCFLGSYSSYVFPLLLLKWLPYLQFDIDMSNEAIDFFKENSWSRIESLNRDIGQKLTEIFSWIHLENSSCERGFINRDASQWIIISDSTLSEIIKNISIFDFPDSSLQQSNLICEIYEAIIIDTGLYESKSNINLYTPRDLAKLVVDLINPNLGMEIYDPAFGFGSILIESVRHLINQGNNPHKIHVCGQEKNYELRSTVSIILVLHGVLNFNIYQEKSIEFRNDNRKFDVVISNPPFGAKNWEDYGQDDDSLYLQYGYPPKNSADYAFILKALAVLSDQGKSAIIVPHGVLFREGAEGKIRKNIIENNLIEAIVSLPQSLFYNTKIPTAIILFNKNKMNEDRGILFVDASNEYGVSRKRNFLTDENIARICSVYYSLQEEYGYSRIASKEEMRNFDYNLSPKIYVQKEQALIDQDIDSQIEKVHILESQRAETESQMDIILNALNVKI